MKKKEHDKLAIRLAQILIKLNSGEKVTVKSLSEEFCVSRKTIQTDLNARFSYLPIETKGYTYFLPEYALGKFNSKDIKDFADFSGIRELYPSLNDNLIIDILNTKVNQALSIRGQSYEDLREKQPLFDELGSAIVLSQEVRFHYKDTIRVVQPYKLINTNGIWYLAAVEENILKKFGFNKISNFRITSETFTRDKEIEQRVEDTQSNWFGEKEIEVTLDVDGSVSEYFLRRELLPHQKILERSKERLIVSTTIAYDEELLRIVRYWMPHITILSPATLQDKLESSLQHYLKLHAIS